MKVRVAAYKLLVELARADGGLGRAELEELERYHEALDIDPEELLRETQTPLASRVLEGGQVEREEVVRAMAQVALSDGRMSRRERRRIRRVARELGIQGIQLANLLRAEQRARGAHGVGVVGRSVATWGVVAALVGVGWNATRSTKTEAGSSRQLQALAEGLDGALVLVETSYEFTKEGHEPIGRTAHGSGFFATPNGQIVTNKHVLQPWKFQGDATQLRAKGYVLDETSVRHIAWRSGSTLGERDDISRGDWSTQKASLMVERYAPDRWVKATRSCSNGKRVHGTFHGLGSGDLAILHAALEGPVPFIPLAASSATVRALDPVVVLGFPKGPVVFERGRVISMPSLGEVGKVEDSLAIQAPMDGGNSGGPIVSLDGEAIGVAARKFPGQQGLARCIRCEEVHRLLGGR